MADHLISRRAVPPEDIRTTVYLFMAIWLLLAVFAIVAYYLPPDALQWTEGTESAKRVDISWTQPLFDSFSEGVLLVDMDTSRIVLANQALRRAGIDPASLVGKDVKQILPKESWLTYDRARQESSSYWGEESRYIRDDQEGREGVRPWLRVSLRGLPCRIFPARIPLDRVQPTQSLAPAISTTTLAKS